MNPIPGNLAPEETQAVLADVLHALEGKEIRLDGWTADNGFTEHGKRRVVRYDLEAQDVRSSHTRRYRWVGKFYDRDEDARRVSAVLERLSAADGRARGSVAVPSVLAYHVPRRLLMLTYEPGEPVSYAIARDTDQILVAVARTLATLHAASIVPPGVISPDSLLRELGPKIENLCAHFPSEETSVRSSFDALRRDAPPLPSHLSFVHGDFGPANLLWRSGYIVVLDFDKCARGDPAADLGNLLGQLFRISIRKPERLRDFASARAKVLETYRRWSPADPGIDERIAWYERATILRKVHSVTFGPTADEDEEEARRREADAFRLLRRE